MSHLGAENGLGTRGQAGVTDFAPFVVLDVAGLLLGREPVPAPVHGQHQVSLLDHLVAVQRDVRRVQQRVALPVLLERPFGHGGEVPGLLVHPGGRVRT